jgi:hypothetical protein
MFTLFSRKASASSVAPTAPIFVSARLSVVSVYERIVMISTRKIRRRTFLLCLLGKHQPVLWLTHRRSHCMRD